MVISADGAPTVAEPNADGRAGSGSERRTCWVIRRGLLASAVGLALAPLVGASRPPRSGDHTVSPADTGEPAFDETYRGPPHPGHPAPPPDGCGDDCAWQVTVDGRPLHLMRRADGTWLSMVDHYSSYRHLAGGDPRGRRRTRPRPAAARPGAWPAR